MKISDVLESEQSVISFFDRMYNEFVDGVIPKIFYHNFLGSIDSQEVFIRWMLLNSAELVYYSIFSYDYDTVDKFMALSRTDRMLLIETLSSTVNYTTLLKKLQIKYRPYLNL